MKKCPRCHAMRMKDDDILNKLSRRDNKTYICSRCGGIEAYIDAGLAPDSKIERDFVAKVRK